MTSSREVRAAGMSAGYSAPSAEGRWPGLLLLHEASGLNDDIRGIAERLAGEGYAVLAPDLYSAGRRPLCIAAALIGAVTDGDRTVRRLGPLRDWLADQPEVHPDRLGVIGYCMGGGFALAAAVRYDFAAASVNYGAVPRRAESLSTTRQPPNMRGSGSWPSWGSACGLRDRAAGTWVMAEQRRPVPPTPGGCRRGRDARQVPEPSVGG